MPDLNAWRGKAQQEIVEDLLTPEDDENPGFHIVYREDD